MMNAFISEECVKLRLINNTCVSGENSNFKLFTRCFNIIGLTPGIGSEVAVKRKLTSMEISTSFVALHVIRVFAYNMK